MIYFDLIEMVTIPYYKRSDYMIKKERMKGFVAGIALTTVLMGTSVFAQTYIKQLNAVYDDIKIVIDGIRVTPKDGNGKKVEPFRVEGTTYLPVRAVAEALGKPVKWDSRRNEVVIGTEVTINNELSRVIFKDKALEDTVRDAINKPTGDILKSDLQSLTELSTTYPMEVLIENIEGMEYMVNLEKIDFWRNNIEDLTPLRNLTKLKYLELGDNSISDISALSSLTNLETLSLHRNDIRDVTPLRNLTKLSDLNLSFNNNLSDLSPLDNLKLLEDHPFSEEYSLME